MVGVGVEVGLFDLDPRSEDFPPSSVELFFNVFQLRFFFLAGLADIPK